MYGDRDQEALVASVVVLTKNGAATLRGCLEGVFSQEGNIHFEVLVVDSGSEDGTLEIVKDFPVRLLQIHPWQFNHGDTRNLGASLSHGKFVLFLTQDAVPADKKWLPSLLKEMEGDPQAAGAYSRILPRPDADPISECDVLSDLNASPEPRVQRLSSSQEYLRRSPYDRRMVINFHDISSCIRKDVWERIPFPRFPFGEDLAWAKAALRAGHTIRFAPTSVVYHSHRYSVRGIYGRTWIDGKTNQILCGRKCIAKFWHILIMVPGLFFRDLSYLMASKRKTSVFTKTAHLLRSPFFHFSKLFGLYLGGRREEKELNCREVSREKLKILFVLHGFPPDTWAGTEVYTLNIARELQARGHAVTLLYRTSDSSMENYTFREESFENLRVIRLANHLVYSSIEETYRNPHVERCFHQILETERPDVVHFQHALHLSTSLLELSSRRGIPTLITLNDYWFICPKVQLIRPDGKLCEGVKAGLGCLQCAEGRASFIALARWTTRLTRPFLWPALKLLKRGMKSFPLLKIKPFLDITALYFRKKTVLSDLNQAHLAIAPSRFLMEKYLQYGLDPQRIVHSPYGILGKGLQGIQKRESQGNQGGGIRFAFIGSLVWYKGVGVLIDAFNRIPKGSSTLKIFGATDSPPKVKAFYDDVKKKAVHPGITFEGSFDNSELPRIYEEIDVLVVPSLWYENAPLTIQEAFLARTPVITSDIGGMAELVHHESNGLHFRAGDPDDLARKMKRFIELPELVKRFGARAGRVKSVQENAEELELCYRRLLSSLPQREGAAKGEEGSYPLLEKYGKSFQKKKGLVECQGEEMVLLRPSGGKSSVTYSFPALSEDSVAIEIETFLIRGERNVLLGGGVFLNGTLLGTIPTHAWQGKGEEFCRFRFNAKDLQEKNELTLTNTMEGGEEYYLRIRRVSLFREKNSSSLLPLGTSKGGFKE